MNVQPKLAMIIDDNEFDSYLSSSLLVSSQFATDVLEFDSAILALNYLESNCNESNKLPFIIFLDLYMPLMNGFEFMEKFAALPDKVKSLCKICVFSTTVNDDFISKVRKSLSGNCLYTSKPLTEEFLKRIKV